MKLGLDVSQHHLAWSEIVERTRLGEDAGFDSAWVFDHFTALYADERGPCLEAWTLLAGLAAVTTRIRLGALVTGITYRHPSLLASEAVTVDHISGGRLELGVGAAWHEPEHRRLGFDFPERGERVARLEEALQVMRILMTTDGETFDGAHYRLEDGWYYPRPVQQPHPPIWVGGGRDKMLGVAGRHADVWHGFGDAETLKERSAKVTRAAEAAGRDPEAIVRSTALSLSQPLDAIRRDAEAKREAGFTYLTVGWPSEGRERLDEFVERVMPALRDL